MLNLSHLYDRKYLFKCLAQLALVIALMRVSGGAGFVVVIPFVLVGLIRRNSEQVFFGLLMAICLTIGNGNIVRKGTVFAWSQRGLMIGLGLCMSVQILGSLTHRVLKPFAGMLAYIAFMFLSSAQGWCPKISYMKLFMFTVIYFSYFGVANQVGVNPRVSTRRIRAIMLTIAIFFIFGSMALVPFPGLSQLKAQQILEMGGSLEDLQNQLSLFVGMTTHSQCLGPVVSTAAVILLGDLLFSIRKFDALYVSLLLCCPFLIYKTSSRTGMGAFVLGMLFIVFLFVRSRGVGRRWKGKVLNWLLVIGMAMAFVVVCSSGVRGGIKRFVLKFSTDNSDEVTTEQVFMTRRGKVDESLENFKKSPLLGNGFQVGEGMRGMKVNGLVLSAPIEKGVWVTAVLEEGGVIGWVIFIVFLTTCITTAIRRKAYIGASCLVVFALTNFGEFTFFSMSYSGGFGWAMVFAGLALDIRKMKDENEELRRQMIARQMQLEMQMEMNR